MNNRYEFTEIKTKYIIFKTRTDNLTILWYYCL